MTIGEAGSAGEAIPSPSRSLLYGVLGVIVLALLVLLMALVTPRDAGPGVGGPYDSLEAEIAKVYGLSDVIYNSPATSTFSATMNGNAVRCVVPTETELTQRIPLKCGDGITIPAD